MNPFIHPSIPLKALIFARLPETANQWIDRLRQSGFNTDAVLTALPGELVDQKDSPYDVCLVEFHGANQADNSAQRLWGAAGDGCPVILIAERAEEEAALELAWQAGLDCLFTDDLGRLSLAVRQAVKIARSESTVPRELPIPGHEKEQQLQTLIDAAPIGLHQWALRPDGELILIGANPSADHILGIDHQPLIGLTIEDAFPFHRQTEIPAIYRRVVREGIPYSTEQTPYQDGRIQGTFSIHAFKTGAHQMAVFFRDITSKEKAEADTRENEEKYRTLIEQNSEGMVLYDENGLIIEWNTAQELATGIPRAEALGRPVWELQYQVALPDHRSQNLLESMKAGAQKLLLTGQSPIFFKPMEVAIQRSDGKRLTILQTAFPIKTSKGFRIGSILRDITDRKKNELALERRTVELEILHSVSLAGTEAISSDDLLNRAGQIIRDHLKPDHFGVAFFDAEKKLLSYHPSKESDFCWYLPVISIDQGVSGGVVRTGLARRVDDVWLEPDYLAGNPNTRAELCVPISAGGRVIGVVNLENDSPASFSKEDERLMTAVASELGTAFEKIRLLEAEQSRRMELEALEQISAVLRAKDGKAGVLQAVLDKVMSVLVLKGAGFVLRDPVDGALIAEVGRGIWSIFDGARLPETDHIASQVAATQHYFLDNEIQETDGPLLGATGRARCLLCLALIVEGRTQGLLYLGRDTPFLKMDVHLAIAMADSLAGALHRVDLNDQTRRQLDRLTALRAIDQSILSRLGLQETLELLLEKIAQQLQVDAASILLYQPKAHILVTAAERGMPPYPLWDPASNLPDTHAGRAALNQQTEIIPDLCLFDDSLT